MKRSTVFIEGMGAAGMVALLLALSALFVLRRGVAPRLERLLVRGPAALPADYPDLCRAAGL